MMKILDRHASTDFKKKNVVCLTLAGAREARSSSLGELPGQNRRA
jgi:hypothetical protein